MWALDNPNSQARIEAIEAKGRRVPDRLYPPDVNPGAVSWFDDFFELGTDRQLTGYGAGPIPASSISRHVEGWSDHEAWQFRHVMRRLDNAWLKRQSPDGGDDLPVSDNPARDAFRGGNKK